MQTGFHDSHGIPIHVGDLIRTFHYVHRHSRRRMWLYFRVAEIGGQFVVQNWDDMDATRWQCLLADAIGGTTEVLAESGIELDDDGNIRTFNERPRKRGGQ